MTHRIPGEIRPIIRKADIPAQYRRWIRWLDVDPISPQEPKPFDFDRCCARAMRIPTTNTTLYDLDLWLSKEEAWFWYCFITTYSGLEKREYKEALRSKIKEEMLPPEEFLKIVLAPRQWWNFRIVWHWVQILIAFVKPLELAKAYTEALTTHLKEKLELQIAFVEVIYAILSREERAEFRTYIEKKFNASKISGQEDRGAWFSLMCLCGWPGLSPYFEQTRPRLSSLRLCVNLPSEQEFIAAVYQSHLDAHGALIWLAATEWRSLQLVVMSVLEGERGMNLQYSKAEIIAILEVMAKIEAPEVAEHMLHLRHNSKGRAVAADWLDRHPFLSTIALVPIALKDYPDTQHAKDQLLEYIRTGKETDVRDAIPHLTELEAAWLEKEILPKTTSVTVPEVDILPPDLATSLKLQSIIQLPNWLKVPLLPPLTVSAKRLSDEFISRLLSALKSHPSTHSVTVIKKIKEYADPASLDKFIWELCTLWIGIAAPPEEKWVVRAVSLLGGNLCILNLTPFIRKWPGEGYNGRSIMGIDCLRGMGTDNALLALNGIAQKLKFKPLQKRAQKMMEEIAQERGLTAEQLADRVIPDCDLDDKGSLVFDFGPRQFNLILDKHLVPMIRDDTGK